MNKFESKIANNNMYWRIMLRINVILFIFLAMALFGWNKSAQNIRIDIPPDLSSGASLKPGQRQEHVIYNFALNIFQQLQRWRESGVKDYYDNIFKYDAYITPSYSAFLKRDYERRKTRGELSNRKRAIQTIPGIVYQNDRVKALGTDAWVVFLDVELEETYQGESIKSLFFRYPMLVKSYDVDIQTNPWGLALDGYHDNPIRLNEKGEATATDVKSND